MIYPTQKGVAFKLIYGPKWQMGQSPERVKLGSMLLPNGFFCDQNERAIRRRFPDANAFRVYGNDGSVWFCGSC